MKKTLIIILIVAAVVFVTLYIFKDDLMKAVFRPTDNFPGEPGIKVSEVEVPDIRVVAEDIDIPWEIAFLPGGEMLITERSGDLLKIGEDRTVIDIEGVEHIGEGGLLGLALHPDFVDNDYVYLYLTTRTDGDLINRVERYKLIGDTLTNKTEIISDIPGAQYHDGGRIAFGPDGKLYITTGDAGKSDMAQDTSYLGGKVLRVNDDGSIPSDNPFSGSPVWSYGHRNPQGLAWDDEGGLWSTEHGRSGAFSGYDELNIIEPGGNYGWPVIEGSRTGKGMMAPVINSGADYTWAPAGMAYFEGRIFFAGLRGEALYEYDIESGMIKNHFFGEYGRLRAVTIGPDGFMYISTSNRDGRGDVRSGDDRIIGINMRIFSE